MLQNWHQNAENSSYYPFNSSRLIVHSLYQRCQGYINGGSMATFSSKCRPIFRPCLGCSTGDKDLVHPGVVLAVMLHNLYSCPCCCFAISPPRHAIQPLLLLRHFRLRQTSFFQGSCTSRSTLGGTSAEPSPLMEKPLQAIPYCLVATPLHFEVQV